MIRKNLNTHMSCKILGWRNFLPTGLEESLYVCKYILYWYPLLIDWGESISFFPISVVYVLRRKMIQSLIPFCCSKLFPSKKNYTSKVSTITNQAISFLSHWSSRKKRIIQEQIIFKKAITFCLIGLLARKGKFKNK